MSTDEAPAPDLIRRHGKSAGHFHANDVNRRGPGQGPAVQFSNFSLLENRRTHELELHLTTYGQEADPKDWATADN